MNTNSCDCKQTAARGKLIQVRVSEPTYQAIKAAGLADRRKIAPYLKLYLEEMFAQKPERAPVPKVPSVLRGRPRRP